MKKLLISLFIVVAILTFVLYSTLFHAEHRQPHGGVLVSETFEKFPVGKLSFSALASDIGNTELACG